MYPQFNEFHENRFLSHKITRVNLSALMFLFVASSETQTIFIYVVQCLISIKSHIHLSFREASYYTNIITIQTLQSLAGHRNTIVRLYQSERLEVICPRVRSLSTPHRPVASSVVWPFDTRFKMSNVPNASQSECINHFFFLIS